MKHVAWFLLTGLLAGVTVAYGLGLLPPLVGPPREVAQNTMSLTPVEMLPPLQRVAPPPSRLDPQVRQASGVAVVPLATAVSGQPAETGGPLVDRVSQTFQNFTYHWPVRLSGQAVQLLGATEVSLHGAGDARRIRLSVNGTDVGDPATAAGEGRWMVPNTKLTLRSGENKVVIQDVVGNTINGQQELRLITPQPDSPSIAIVATSNNRYAQQGTPVATAVRVYGSYLRLQLEAAAGSSLHFLFVDSQDKTVQELLPVSQREETRPNPQTRIAELRLPTLGVSGTGKLLVLAESGGRHRYAAPLDYTIRPNTAALPTPVLREVRYPSQSDARQPKRVGDTYYLNSPELLIKGTVQALGGDERVVLLYDGNVLATEPLDPVPNATSGAWEATIKVAPDNLDHRLEAVLALGDRIGDRSNTLTLKQRTTGPRVVGDDRTGVSFSPGASTLTVQFGSDNRLDADAANDPRNYLLLKTTNDPAGSGTEVSPGPRPTFADANNSVLLQLGQLDPGTYRLVIRGKHTRDGGDKGIRDVYGNYLESATTDPGGVRIAEIAFERPVGADLPSVRAGITGQPAPYVTYPEFTRPRNVPAGFNPADIVETRVSRLYYNRDGHRVAQILNREAKSYNRAAVEVRRRMADKARDEANKLTDGRRAYERAAVQAAGAARQIERELLQAQQELAEARDRTGRATQAAAQTRRVFDETLIDRPATQAEQQRILGDLNAEIAGLRQRRTAEEARLAALERDLEDLRLERAALPRATQTVEDTIERLRAEQAQRRARMREIEQQAEKGQADINQARARIDQIDEALKKPLPPNQQKALQDERQQQVQFVQGRTAELAKLTEEHTALRTRAELEIPQLLETEGEKLRAARQRPAVIDAQLAEKAEQRQVARQVHADLDARITTLQNRLGATENATRARESWRVSAETTAATARDEEQKMRAVEGRIQSLQAALQTRRAEEVQANENALKATAEEDRAREEQFRREVAAAHEDPDTFAPGKPDSIDPVEQVSISVVGEGLIQFRGPLKGINLCRTMVNQLDAPVGQVRVAVHTVQVNGEHGDRMEKVVHRIRRYIDHSRFLTVQSGQILRKAVTTVAARKAEQAALTCPYDSQEARDQKYLYAFFGKDFTDELRAMDSELLRSGNKLLCLHSMDSTSLASALFLLALAKNATRREILMEAERLLGHELPVAEQNYFQAAGDAKDCKKFQFLGGNARFESLKGFFNLELHLEDTMTPVQRDVIRLAQIFKSQLITELELRQRIMERALIEERIGRDYRRELEEAYRQEKEAERILGEVRDQMREQQQKVLGAANVIEAEIVTILNDLNELREVKEVTRLTDEADLRRALDPRERGTGTTYAPDVRRLYDRLRATTIERVGRILEYFKGFVFGASDQPRVAEADQILQLFVKGEVLEGQYKEQANRLLQLILDLLCHVERRTADFKHRLGRLIAELLRPDPDINRAYGEWSSLRDQIRAYVTGRLEQRASVLFGTADEGFRALLQQNLRHQTARQKAEESRRPLDHKKLLDMLIDEMQDKYIELLEGTRAHTANVDNYIKALATALDDDLNTQFYLPAFREVREASRLWDVTLGKVETTSVLTNNRMFAKVSPEATMEFDLPKRDILITEAFKGTKAIMDEYGALLQDPTFLSILKLRSGQPPSSPVQGAAGGLSLVRNVLPGIPSGTEERVLTQGGPGRREFGSAFEALIPDPAIYKFETGTGYEIRPVISPDGQAVVFHFNYMYTTNVREPVRADEKHLGRVKRHFIDTDVQLGNYELREVSKYQVALKASRTARGVPLLEDIPGVGLLFRPLPQQESSLQENLIYAQATIFPTLFDLMGLRWAPVVADLDPLGVSNAEFVVRGRRRELMNRVFDFSSHKVDEFLRIPPAERRGDLYRSQETIPFIHPNGYKGPGLNLRDSHLHEGYDPRNHYPPSQAVPSRSPDGALYPRRQQSNGPMGVPVPGQGMPSMPEMPPMMVPNGHGAAPLHPGVNGQGMLPPPGGTPGWVITPQAAPTAPYAAPPVPAPYEAPYRGSPTAPTTIPGYVPYAPPPPTGTRTIPPGPQSAAPAPVVPAAHQPAPPKSRSIFPSFRKSDR